MIRPTSVEVAPLIAAYYRKHGNEAGGNCHGVLDDGNLGDDSVWFCGSECAAAGDLDGCRIMFLFLGMRKTARLKAIQKAKAL